MEVETQRFLLMEFIESHRQSFLTYQSDRRYQAAMPFEALVEDPSALFDMFLIWAAEIPRLRYQLAILERGSSGRLIGCCGLRAIDGSTSQGELGIELAPDHWGRYMCAVEVVDALLRFAFDEIGWTSVIGRTTSDNDRVRRLAEWFGAEVVSPAPPFASTADGRWSEVVWRITLNRWIRHRPSVRC